MVNIRQATASDLLDMQTTNLWCLPENYQVRPFKTRLGEDKTSSPMSTVSHQSLLLYHNR